MCLILICKFNTHILYFYLYVFNTYNFCIFLNTFFADLLNTYLIAARENCQILKNGSEYQGAWPPLL